MRIQPIGFALVLASGGLAGSGQASGADALKATAGIKTTQEAQQDLEETAEKQRDNLQRKRLLRDEQEALEGLATGSGRGLEPGVTRNPAAAELRRRVEGGPGSEAPAQKPAELRLDEALRGGQKPAEFRLDGVAPPTGKKKGSKDDD